MCIKITTGCFFRLFVRFLKLSMSHFPKRQGYGPSQPPFSAQQPLPQGQPVQPPSSYAQGASGYGQSVQPPSSYAQGASGSGQQVSPPPTYPQRSSAYDPGPSGSGQSVQLPYALGSSAYGPGPSGSGQSAQLPSSYAQGASGSGQPVQPPSSYALGSSAYGPGPSGSGHPVQLPYAPGSSVSGQQVPAPSSYAPGPSGSGQQVSPPPAYPQRSSAYGPGPSGSGQQVSAPSSYAQGFSGLGQQVSAPSSYGQSVQAPLKPVGTTGYSAGSASYGQQGAFGGQEDWFSQAGIANALTAAAVGAMANPASAFDMQQHKSLSWLQGQTAFLRHYFNITHSYVLWKLLFVLVPFADRARQEEEHTGDGNGEGLRLLPGKRPDLYLPLMGFISFVLLHGLSKGIDFHPDNLYNIASLSLLLLLVEVVVLKAASYLMNASNWALTDILAVTGYKFVNMSAAALFLMIFGDAAGRAIWAGVWILASLTAGITVQRGLLAAGSDSSYFNVGTSSSVLSHAAGAAQLLWCWFLMPALGAGEPLR